jgi:hypothetical protein
MVSPILSFFFFVPPDTFSSDTHNDEAHSNLTVFSYQPDRRLNLASHHLHPTLDLSSILPHLIMGFLRSLFCGCFSGDEYKNTKKPRMSQKASVRVSPPSGRVWPHEVKFIRRDDAEVLYDTPVSSISTGVPRDPSPKDH